MQNDWKRRLTTVCGVLVLAASVPAYAAVDSFMTIDGAPGGKIQVMSVAHTGRAGGQAGEIIITKEIDRASPMLNRACASGKHISMALEFSSGAGAGKRAQKIEVTDATVVSVRVSGQTETVTLRYPQVAVTWTDGGKTATDDWESPK